MPKTETYICRNGTNKNTPVSFTEGETEFVRSTPCDGCVWRHSIDFQLVPEFEGKVDPLSMTRDQVDAYYAYQDARKAAGEEAKKRGGVFSWEHLRIERFPNLENGIACWVEPDSG